MRSRDLPLKGFEILNIETISEILMELSNKSCDLDVFPIKFVKEHLGNFSPMFMHLFNVIFMTGNFPTKLKTALVNPIIKGKDIEDFKSYRPVSNIQYLSKGVEKHMSEDIVSHMEENDLQEKCQSGFRKHFGVETAMLRVTNDIYMKVGEGKSVALCMIDLSAAFDTIDHDILFELLEDKLKNHRFGFGITEKFPER